MAPGLADLPSEMLRSVLPLGIPAAAVEATASPPRSRGGENFSFISEGPLLKSDGVNGAKRWYTTGLSRFDFGLALDGLTLAGATDAGTGAAEPVELRREAVTEGVAVPLTAPGRAGAGDAICFVGIPVGTSITQKHPPPRRSHEMPRYSSHRVWARASLLT